MSQPDEISHDELMDLVDDEIDNKFGKASDGGADAEADGEPDVNDADLEGAPEPTDDPEADADDAESESDKYAAHITYIVGMLLQAKTDDTRIDQDQLVTVLDTIAKNTTASGLLPVTLRSMQEKMVEEELVEVLDYFAYRCCPLYETTAEVDRDNLSVQTRRFLAGEMEWSQVTPIEKVWPTLPEENDDLVSIEDLANESGLKPTDVIEIAGLDPIDKSISLTTKISKFNFILNSHKFWSWCRAVKAQESAEAETDPMPEPQPEPPTPDDSDRADEADELAASTVAGRLGLNYKDVLKLADVTTNEDGTPADGLSKVSLSQVRFKFEQVCVWMEALKAETKPKPQPKPEPKKTDETPKPGESEVDDEAKSKAEAGQDTSKKPFDHAEEEDEDDEIASTPAAPAFAVDWEKYEGEFEDGRDPKWRPQVDKTGDPVLDMINEDLALTESWDD